MRGAGTGERPAALVLFTRVPVAGRAKTRLLPVLSGRQCAALQRAMACDAAAALGSLGLPLTVRYADDTAGLPDGGRVRAGFLDEVRACAETAGSPRVSCLPQEGEGLGERMGRALGGELAAGAPACLLMGSDLPLVGPTELRAAADALRDGPADVVLGPSDDGGYWLVGLRAAFPDLFAGKRYGTGSVLDEALATCRAAGRTAALGPVARDVDTPDDLAWLARLATAGDSHVGVRTAAWLRGEGLA